MKPTFVLLNLIGTQVKTENEAKKMVELTNLRVEMESEKAKVLREEREQHATSAQRLKEEFELRIQQNIEEVYP